MSSKHVSAGGAVNTSSHPRSSSIHPFIEAGHTVTWSDYDSERGLVFSNPNGLLIHGCNYNTSCENNQQVPPATHHPPTTHAPTHPHPPTYTPTQTHTLPLSLSPTHPHTYTHTPRVPRHVAECLQGLTTGRSWDITWI
jgi:hypothetical protein